MNIADWREIRTSRDIFLFSADCATAVAAMESDAIFKKLRREPPVGAAELKDDKFRGFTTKI